MFEKNIPSLKLTISHLKMDGLEYDCFLLGFGLFFRGKLAVSFRECKNHLIEMENHLKWCQSHPQNRIVGEIPFLDFLRTYLEP